MRRNWWTWPAREQAGRLPAAWLPAEGPDGEGIGFAEVGLRSHADRCAPAQPVRYLEGWFVEEAWRGQGVGRVLIAAAEEWA